MVKSCQTCRGPGVPKVGTRPPCLAEDLQELLGVQDSLGVAAEGDQSVAKITCRSNSVLTKASASRRSAAVAQSSTRTSTAGL